MTEIEPVILSHFKPEEIESLRAEHERQKQVFLGHAYLDNDGERLREAMQRMVALEANHAMETDEYAEVLYETGRIEEAIVLMKDPIKKAHYQQRLDAILKDDGAWCNCDGEKQVIRRYPSMKHGKSIAVVKCTKCEFVNVSDQL